MHGGYSHSFKYRTVFSSYNKLVCLMSLRGGWHVATCDFNTFHTMSCILHYPFAVCIATLKSELHCTFRSIHINFYCLRESVTRGFIVVRVHV